LFFIHCSIHFSGPVKRQEQLNIAQKTASMAVCSAWLASVCRFNLELLIKTGENTHDVSQILRIQRDVAAIL
jgi:hypothetical protein